jgi:surface protein
MRYAFSNCWNISSLNLLSFDTSKVTNMEHMFDYDISLISLDLSSFTTNEVKNMNYMFSNCDELISLDISQFDSSKATIQDIFTNSPKLEKIICRDEKICEWKPSGSQCGPN